MARIKIVYPEKTIYQQESRIRISDLTTSKHLGFDSLVVMLNDASAGFFRANGIERGNRNGIGIIYTDLAVSYRAEVFYGDVLHIEAAVKDITAKGFDLIFRVSSTENKAVVALAKISVLFFDYEKRRAINMPEQFRTRIDRFKTRVKKIR